MCIDFTFSPVINAYTDKCQAAAMSTLKLNIPILVGIGEQDESVPVESARFLESRFKEAGKSNLILNIYPGSNHRLSGNGVSHRSEFFAELSRLLQPTHNIVAPPYLNGRLLGKCH